MYEIILSKQKPSIILSNVQLKGHDNSTKIDMMLDTGAGYSLIPLNAAIILGHKLSDKKMIPIITGNGRINVPLIMLNSITVGDIEVKNISVICHTIEMGEVQGLLGLNFLKQVRTVIDYRSLRLEIN